MGNACIRPRPSKRSKSNKNACTPKRSSKLQPDSLKFKSWTKDKSCKSSPTAIVSRLDETQPFSSSSCSSPKKRSVSPEDSDVEPKKSKGIAPAPAKLPDVVRPAAVFEDGTTIQPQTSKIQLRAIDFLSEGDFDISFPSADSLLDEAVFRANKYIVPRPLSKSSLGPSVGSGISTEVTSLASLTESTYKPRRLRSTAPSTSQLQPSSMLTSAYSEVSTVGPYKSSLQKSTMTDVEPDTVALRSISLIPNSKLVKSKTILTKPDRTSRRRRRRRKRNASSTKRARPQTEKALNASTYDVLFGLPAGR